MMNKLRDILLILLGVIIIAFTLFNRFLRERIPHEITFEYNNLKFITLIIIIFISIIALHRKVRKLFNKEDNNKWRNNILIKRIFKFFEIIQQSLDKILKLLLNHETIKRIVFKISKLLFPLMDYTKWVSLFLIALPRIIVAFTFFIDVCIFNNFHYFYKTVPLLILPLVISSIVYMFKFWAEQMREEMKEVIIVKPLKYAELDGLLNNNVQQIVTKVPSTEEDDYYFFIEYRKDINNTNKDPEDLYVYKNMFLYSFLLLNFEMNFNENADEKWFLLINCISKLLFIISWIYIIIKMVLM